jgi:alpha-L-arabinofuranosidase
LFAHVDAWQWRPDMIWYDNLRSVKSANYYVQQLYATHSGTHVWDAISNGQTLAGEVGIYASVVRDAKTNEIIVKVANTNKERQSVKINLNSVNGSMGNQATHILFKSELGTENTLDNPELAVPVQSKIEVADKILSTDIEAESFNVYILKMN